MSIIKCTGFVSLNVEGFHSWKDVPEYMPHVLFLRERHRHLFNFKVHFTLEGYNREEEFFTVQKELKEVLAYLYPASPLGIEFGDRSCERIALEVLEYFKKSTKVEVSEDGENGAIVEAV